MASITVPEVEAANRHPMHVVAVVDVSGSMSGEKMRKMQETLSFLVHKGLAAQDSFGIVAFGSEVSTPLGMCKMDAQGKQLASAQVSGLRIAGQTNLSGGLLRGIQLQQGDARSVATGLRSLQTLAVEAVHEQGASDAVPEAVMASLNGLGTRATQAILLFTDGMANKGIVDADGILAAAQGAMGGSPTTIFTFGFGASHNEDLLQALAQRTNGLYYFIDTAEDIPSAFADCLGGLISIVAQNATLELRPLAEARLGRALCAYRIDSIEGGAAIDISLGDLYAEDEKDVLVELNLPQLSQPLAAAEVLTAKLRYFSVVSNRMEERRAALTVSRPVTEPPSQPANVRLDEQRNRLLVAEAVQEATRLADSGQVAQGRARLVAEQMRASTTISYQMQSPAVQGLMQDLSTVQRDYGDHAAYARRGAKVSKMTLASHAYQRSNHETSQTYATKSKMAMRAAWTSAPTTLGAGTSQTDFTANAGPSEVFPSCMNVDSGGSPKKQPAGNEAESKATKPASFLSEMASKLRRSLGSVAERTSEGDAS